METPDTSISEADQIDRVAFIGERAIGAGHPPYVIAELGVNHDGDPAKALELVRIAADAGADAIKLQLFEAERLMSADARLAAYQADAGERDPVVMLRRLELPIEAMAPAVDLAHSRGLHAIVSIFSTSLVDAAMRLPWDAFKVASPDIINLPLLDALMATGKPMIVSTGASTLDEVQRAAGWLEQAAERTMFLQCVSSYPVPEGFDALEGIGAVAKVTRAVCGYSDHLWLMSDQSAPAMLTAFKDGLWQAALKLQALGVRLQLRGDPTCLDPTTLALLQRLQQATQYNDGLLLVLGMDYRQPWLAEGGPARPSGKAPWRTSGQDAKCRPDPDLLIRTGGTLSSCTGLLWDTRHTALYLTDCLWPHFNAAALDDALQWFGDRQRRQWTQAPATS